jgi:hypothetical protein
MAYLSPAGARRNHPADVKAVLWPANTGKTLLESVVDGSGSTWPKSSFAKPRVCA